MSEMDFLNYRNLHNFFSTPNKVKVQLLSLQIFMEYQVYYVLGVGDIEG